MTRLRVLSKAQQAAFALREVPPVEEVTPGVIAIPVPMEGSYLAYSLSYLIEGPGDELAMIDAGIDSDRNWELLQDAVAAAGHSISDISTVVVTHLHRDHTGMASRIRTISGACIAMHAEDARAMAAGARHIDEADVDRVIDEWGVPSEQHDRVREVARQPVALGPYVQVDRMLEDADLVEVGDRALRVIHTPGHTRGHIVVAEDASRLLFTGDHLLPMISTGIGLGGLRPGDDPLEDYLGSLDAIASLHDYIACPGHGYRFEGVTERCADSRRHLLRRRAEVAAVLAAQPELSVWELAEQLTWTSGWANLTGVHLFSALLQTSLHARRVTST